MQALKKLLIHELRIIADKIEGGTCELSETEASEIMEVITHIALSKEQACNYLNLSRSRFDDLVREGKIPKGRKRTGFKELVWIKADLDKIKLNRH